MKSIVSYIDYREYLRDFYVERKNSVGFSFRDFARTAGFSSPVSIKLVMDGKANLALSSAAKLCDAMGLRNKDRLYFKALVRFGQAKKVEEKVRYLEKIKSFHSSISVMGLSNDQFSYFSKWYHAVIRELITLVRFDGDYEKLAGLVSPPISMNEARESVELLLTLNLIEKGVDGQYTISSKFLTSDGMESGALAVRNIQKTMAQLAARAVDTMPPQVRDISGVSISISEKSLSVIREELRICRRRIFEIAAEDTQCNSVYRVNLHLFPISGEIPSAHLKKKRGGRHE